MTQSSEPAQDNKSTTPLRCCVETAVLHYIEALDGEKPCDLYKLVIGETEHALFKIVLEYAQGNQTRAAEFLSINRGTLRKKLRLHGLND